MTCSLLAFIFSLTHVSLFPETYVKVLGVNFSMFGKVEVLLGHENTLY